MPKSKSIKKFKDGQKCWHITTPYAVMDSKSDLFVSWHRFSEGDTTLNKFPTKRSAQSARREIIRVLEGRWDSLTNSKNNLIRKYLAWEKNMKKVLPMHRCMTDRRNLYHGGEVVEFTEKCNEVDNCKKHENCECPIKVKLTCGREVIVPMYDFEFCESHEEISCKQCRAVLRERAYGLEKAKREKEK